MVVAIMVDTSSAAKHNPSNNNNLPRCSSRKTTVAARIITMTYRSSLCKPHMVSLNDTPLGK